MSPAARLRALGACAGAVVWVKSHPRTRPARLWQTCQRGDWMLWIAVRLRVERRLLLLAACDCVRPALCYVPAGERLPLHAIETVEALTRGESPPATVSAAAMAALYAALYASDDAAALYAYYAARAAYSAYSAADYVVALRYSAAAAAAAALRYSAASLALNDLRTSAAFAASLARSADLVRTRIPWAAIEPLWGAP